MFDVISYIFGLTKGKAEGEKTVIIETDNYVFKDPDSDGNIVIEEAD